MTINLRDPAVFAALEHEDVRSYLQATGWQDAGRIQDKGTVHLRADASGQEWEILLPLRRNLGDYVHRMAEAVHYIARVEARPASEVLNDLRPARAPTDETAARDAG